MYFFPEYDFDISVVCPDYLKITKKVTLEKPSFYTPIPPHFYNRLKDSKNFKETFLKFEKWKTSYSRITKAAIYHNYWVFQIVNTKENAKQYALLFYKRGSSKLEKTIFIDDLFLGVHKDKFYFFAGGNPGYNEEVTAVQINIYQFDQELK